MHPEDGLPTDLTRTASKPHLHDFGSAFEESIRVGDYLYEIYGSEPEKSPFPPARPYLQDVCPVQIYRNFPTACHYRKSHARKGPSAAETPLGCAEASTDGASCGGRGTVSIHPGGRAAFSVQRSSPLWLLAPKAAYAATSDSWCSAAVCKAPIERRQTAVNLPGTKIGSSSRALFGAQYEMLLLTDLVYVQNRVAGKGHRCITGFSTLRCSASTQRRKRPYAPYLVPNGSHLISARMPNSMPMRSPLRIWRSSTYRDSRAQTQPSRPAKAARRSCCASPPKTSIAWDGAYTKWSMTFGSLPCPLARRLSFRKAPRT